ncbi:hypothetical protein [Streptomyces sp. NPDC059991]|uniref:hypothetical protein n=1 Tax=unclassified Streptomyces TaxID=2593676 RepID=UPI003687AC01
MHSAGTGRTSILPKATESAGTSQARQGTSALASRVPVSMVVLLERDIAYDHEAERARIGVDVVLGDGNTQRAELVLNPPQMYATSARLDRAIRAREAARSMRGR